jgi:DNA (cytosine-5)-methyltransferase 1
LFREFLRVVQEARPRFFVMENVRGILSAAIKHRPLKQRGPGCPQLEPDEELGSALLLLLRELEETGYCVRFDLLNAADFGVPQTRERVVFIGSRDGEPVEMPAKTHSFHPLDGLLPWVSLRDGLRGLRDTRPRFIQLTPKEANYLDQIPEGANWRSLPRRLQAKAVGGAFNSWGGRSGFLRRLSWDKPAPALTTVPEGKATMMCHPKKLRPLSIREYARLQQFPREWTFAGGPPQQYKQIGNAVPLGLGEAIGRALARTMTAAAPGTRSAGVTCPNKGLLKRMAERPRTILNPIRMRKVKTTAAAVNWLNGLARHRPEILAYGENSTNVSAVK